MTFAGGRFGEWVAVASGLNAGDLLVAGDLVALAPREDLDRLFHALADGSRRRMIERLSSGPASVRSVSMKTEMLLMMKCDLCYDRTSVGSKPMCASVCPSGALWYGTRQEIEQREMDLRDALSKGDPVTACEHWQIARSLFRELRLSQEHDAVEARRLGAGGAIAIVDAGGSLLFLERLDDTFR